MDIKWEEDSTISVSAERGEVLLSANRDGLISLAGILLTLAEENPGAHVHLDERNSLEEGSHELIIERVE